ncbi:MAG: cytochrome c [Pirellulaceae bacterium]
MALLTLMAGCTQDMADQPRIEPFEAAAIKARNSSARIPVEGTVARGELQVDAHFYSGRVDGQLATTIPMQVDQSALRRGQQRYNIFCAPCHGRTGYGRGMVVRRGFPAPPSLHIQRLREAPPGHFYDVIANGFGRMADYASQVPPEDRWKIVAYLRALQLSQHAEREILTRADLEKLDASSADADPPNENESPNENNREPDRDNSSDDSQD